MKCTASLHRFLYADNPLLLDIILERNTVDVLHDDILKRRAVAYVEYLDDIRVIEKRYGAGFVAEPAAEFLIVEIFLTKYLDGHYRAGIKILRLVNDSHAAVSHLFEYFIPAVQHLADIFIHIIKHSLPARRLSSGKGLNVWFFRLSFLSAAYCDSRHIVAASVSVCRIYQLVDRVLAALLVKYPEHFPILYIVG